MEQDYKNVASMKLSSLARPNKVEPEFSFGNFRLESDGMLFHAETEIHLPPKELAALRFLLTHAGQIVTPAQLRQALWGDVHVTADSVPRCLSSLRARLEPEQCIQTMYKRGYRLAVPVLRNGSEGRGPTHLAIMPFAVGHSVAEHLGPAIAEEVTTRFTATGPFSVAVVARDSVFTLAHRGLSAVQVGEALKADLVLAGTLLAMVTHYRLRVEMIRVEDGTQIWVEDMLVAHDHVLDLESELVQRLVFRLGCEFFGSPAVRSRAAGHPQAYEVFLRGHQEWQTKERHRMHDGMQHLLQATELDPSLISAQVDLAHVCVTQEFYGFMSPDRASQQIRHIANSISDMAANAPTLLPVLGWINFHVDRDLAQAIDLFSASAHLPHDQSTTRLRVMFALSRRRFEEASEWLQSALLADPYAPWLHGCLAWAWHLEGQRANSVAQIERTLSLFPEDERACLFGALILTFNGQAERGEVLARELVRRTPYFDVATAVHAYALACVGQRDEAYGMLERLQWLSRERFVLRSFTPAAYAALGDMEGAISELRAADDVRCPWFFQALADPRLESLHAQPEFEKMRAMQQQMEASVAESLEYQF